jgi:hypothetical protein
MGRQKKRQRQLDLLSTQKIHKRKRSSRRLKRNSGWQYAGASGANFLQPLPLDAPSGRLSPPPKVFDPSSLPRKRKRSGSLSLPLEALPKSDASPSPPSTSSQPGLIRKSSLKLGKTLLINTYKRLQRRRRGRLTPRRSSSRRQRRKSLR